MRKLIVVALGLAFIATFWIGTASADTTRPLEYSNVDQSVMGPRTSGEAFRTQMQIGASARQHTAALDVASGALRAQTNANNGGGSDFQWGQSLSHRFFLLSTNYIFPSTPLLPSRTHPFQDNQIIFDILYPFILNYDNSP